MYVITNDNVWGLRDLQLARSGCNRMAAVTDKGPKWGSSMGRLVQGKKKIAKQIF